MTDETTYEEIRAEATEKFDLRARLENRGLREGQVTLYLDETAGDELGYARDQKNGFGVVLERERSGVLGELDLDPENAGLLERKAELVKALESTALVVKLRAVPPIIQKGARRRTKESLKIKGKVSEADLPDFNDAYVEHLLSDTIVSIVDRESKAEAGRQTYEDVKFLHDHLPADQWTRLDNKLAEVQFKDVVDESISSDSDF